MKTLLHFLHDERPWGSFDQFTNNEPSTVKILNVLPEKRLSLQKHAHREEYWRVLEGNGTVEIDQDTRELVPGDEVFIPIGTLHRLTGSPTGIRVLEIAFGNFDENDIERVSDDFGRITTP